LKLTKYQFQIWDNIVLIYIRGQITLGEQPKLEETRKVNRILVETQIGKSESGKTKKEMTEEI
jgi:hypothetical protein